MAYCTQSDLVARFGIEEFAELTDNVAATTPNPTVISDACDEASSLIDGYLGVQYTLPLGTVPVIVRKWACDIARKFIWKDRAPADGVVRLNADEAISGLKDIAKGVSSLPDAAGNEPAASDFGIAVATSKRVFTDDLLSAMPGGSVYGGRHFWRTTWQ